MNSFIDNIIKILAGRYADRTEYHIARQIFIHYTKLPEMTLNEMAELCHVSPARLRRFFKDLDLNDCSQIYHEIQISLKIRKDQIQNRYSGFNLPQAASALFKLSRAENMEQFLQEKQIDACLNWLSDQPVVYLITSVELMGEALCFIHDMRLMGICILPCNVNHPDQLKCLDPMQDAILSVSLTGRLLDLFPMTGSLVSQARTRFTISQKEKPEDPFHLTIWGKEEGFSSRYLFLFVLDQLRWRRWNSLNGNLEISHPDRPAGGYMEC